MLKLDNLSKIADSQATAEPAKPEVKDYKITLVKGTSKLQVVDSKLKAHIFGSMGHALAFREKLRKLKDDEEVPLDENEEIPEEEAESDVLVEQIQEILADNSLEEVLEAVVEASNEEQEAKDSLKSKLKSHFTPVADASTLLIKVRDMLTATHPDGYTVTENEDKTVVVAVADGLSAETEEALNLTMHELGYAVASSEANEDKTGTIVYKRVEQPAADSKKPAMLPEVKDAKLKEFRKKLCDTTTTEEAIAAAQGAVDVDGLPPGEVLKEVIEVLSDVIENVKEGGEGTEDQPKPSDFSLEAVQANPMRFLDQKDGVYFDSEMGTFWYDGNTFLKLPTLLEYKASKTTN